MNLFRPPYSSFSNLNRAIIALAFSKLQLPHSAGMMAPNVCFPMKYFSFKILCFHSHYSERFSMPSLFIQMACLWVQVPLDKTEPASLCSELKTKVAQFVQCTKMARKREQMRWTVNELPQSRERGTFYRPFTWRKRGFLFVIHTSPLVIAVTLIWSITPLELYSTPVP